MRRTIATALLAAVGSAMLAGLTEAQPVPECIPSLVAEANADGSITLFWFAISNVTGYQVVVQGGEGEAVPLTPQVTPASTTFTYDQSVPGLAYTFTVVAVNDGTEVARFCPLEVTAVPELPTPLAVALLAAGGAAAFASMRRRV
jgi:hypothetical protein